MLYCFTRLTGHGWLPSSRLARRNTGARNTVWRLLPAVLVIVWGSGAGWADEHDPPPRVAGLATVYYHNSHADLLLGRLLQGQALDGKSERPQLTLASLYLDQVPLNDKGRRLANKHQVPIFGSVREALVVRGNRLSVDGVMLVAEHGEYPESDTGQFQFPKKRMFAEIVQECERSGRVVPVFIDKHLADNWQDAKWIYDEARRLKMPLMAGSSLPVLWRHPPRDVDRDRPLREIVALSYHRLDSYGFHALEMIQCLAERRRGGETGVKSVRTLRDADVWRALDEGLVDRELLAQALSRMKDHPLPSDKKLPDVVAQPRLLVIDYRDGLRASVLHCGTLYIDWSVAWRYQDGHSEAAQFRTQEQRPFSHFACLLRELEPFFRSGKPAWPVERTLLTSGMLDALLISNRDGGRLVETPELAIAYQTDWNWRQPPPPYPDRPLQGP